MISALNIFKLGISETRKMTIVYDHFVNGLKIPHEEVSDILRAQIVNSVSAFDRLIHELVNIGVTEMFLGHRVKTKKFLNQPFKAETLIKSIEFSKPGYIPSSVNDNPQFLIEKEMREKMSYLAFEAPDKVKDALSYIWDNDYKMQVIAIDMALPGTDSNAKQKKLEQELQLIVDRRNQIAHEGDVDPTTNTKRSISKEMAKECIDFMEKLGLSIYKLVTNPSCFISP